MFKKRTRPANQRKAVAEEDGDSLGVPESVREKRAKPMGSVNAQGEPSHIGASTRRGELEVNAAKLERFNDTALTGFKAIDARSQRPSEDAVRRLEIDTDVSMDTRAIHERNRDINDGLKSGSLGSGVYRGLGGYKKYIDQSEGAIANAKISGLLGPARNTLSNVRSTLRIEYWGTSGDGGICKDYKETGYCGWGDTCKFAHDRSDYKPGYILDREWEDKQKAEELKKLKQWERRLAKKESAEELKKATGRAGEEEQIGEEDDGADSDKQSSDEDLPSSCPRCSLKWADCTSDAVVTVCGHHFCEDCAFANFANSPRCLTCSALTNGIFNACRLLAGVRKKPSPAAGASEPSGQWVEVPKPEEEGPS